MNQGGVTPKYITRTILAGGIADIGQYGQYISIVSVSASTVTLSIDDDSPEQIIPGIQINCEDYRYKRLRVANTGGVPATIIMLLSNVPIQDLRGDALLLAIATSLVNIDADTSNIADCEALLTTIDADTGAMNTNLADCEALLTTIDGDTGAIATDAAAMEVLLTSILEELTGETTAATFAAEVTPAAATATSIRASNAARHAIFIQAKSTNAASIYIGSDNTVTNTKWMIELEPGEGYTFDDYQGAIYAYSVAGGDEIAYGEW